MSKIAVLNINGVQTSRMDKLKYYYLVDDNYDFNGNSATDVTNIENINLLYETLRINYCDYRDVLISLNDNLTYNNLSLNEQLCLCKNFIVDKSKRDVHYSDDEQKDNAFEMLLLLEKCSNENLMMKRAENILNMPTISTHKILDDVGVGVGYKDIGSINYKTELESGISYTPVYMVSESGATSGLLNKTEYYKNFVDSNNKGELILVVEEQYSLEPNTESLPNTSISVTARTKTWKWVKTDGNIDDVNIKTKEKKYDTRVKRHVEGIRRRNNVVEQMVDNVGLAGVLSGSFTSEVDAHQKLIALQEKYSSSFNAWVDSGLGSMFDDITNDSEFTWLSDTVVDDTNTQAMCPWMIGSTFRNYIIDKLKGNIK